MAKWTVFIRTPHADFVSVSYGIMQVDPFPSKAIVTKLWQKTLFRKSFTV